MLLNQATITSTVVSPTCYEALLVLGHATRRALIRQYKLDSGGRRHRGASPTLAKLHKRSTDVGPLDADV